MRAVVYAGERKVRVENVPEPTILEPTDALVRATLCGICGTDLHLIGGDAHLLERGTVLGHELVGEVVAAGCAVTAIGVGDRVFASDFVACGRCRWCDRGEHWECERRAFFGSGRSFGPILQGAQAELVRVPYADTVLLPIDPEISDEAAILLADNLPTGWVAVERVNVRPGEIVVVIGGGPVGQLTSLCAQAAGAGIVVVVEPSAERRAFAERYGAIGVAPDAAEATIRALSRDDGADVAIEAVGRDTTLASALQLVRRRGRVVSVGVPSSPTWPFPIADAFARELSLSFAIGDAIRTRRTLIRLLATHALDPTGIVSARVSFDGAAAAYAELQAQRSMKIVIDPQMR